MLLDRWTTPYGFEVQRNLATLVHRTIEPSETKFKDVITLTVLESQGTPGHMIFGRGAEKVSPLLDSGKKVGSWEGKALRSGKVSWRRNKFIGGHGNGGKCG